MFDLLISLIVPVSFMFIIGCFFVFAVFAFRGYAFKVNSKTESEEIFTIDSEMKRLSGQYFKSGCAIFLILAVVLFDGFRELYSITDGFLHLGLDRKTINDFMVYYTTMATLPFVMIAVLLGFMYSIHEKLHELKKLIFKNKN